MHKPPIMATSSSASNWVCGACTSSKKRGKYCAMCATPHPTCKVVLAALVLDVAVPTAAVAVPAAAAKAILSVPTPGAVDVAASMAVVAVPAAVAKAIPSVPMPGAAIGAPTAVAKKAKVTKASALVMEDVAMPTEVVPGPVPVAKAKAPEKSAPGPFHPP
jgi:hypothetical protein